MKSSRSGITLVETLVVLAIVGVLLAILLPAIQYARERARQDVCKSHLKQIVLGIENHESTQASLPPLYFGTFLPQPRWALDEFHFHSWRTVILPQLEQQSLYQSIKLALPATDPANQTALNTTIPLFVCPSSIDSGAVVPDILRFNNSQLPTEVAGTAARSDYEVISGVRYRHAETKDLRYIKFGAWGEPLAYPSTPSGVAYRNARLRDIADGLSQTLLVGERAGRPDIYKKGKLVRRFPFTDPSLGAMDHHQAAWGISTHLGWLLFWHENGINATNSHGVFSFHPGGANVGFADGSVRFLSESMDQPTLNALATRAEGEVANLE